MQLIHVTSPAAHPCEKALAHRRDVSVFVVDDDAWVGDSLGALLDAFGYKTLTYGSGPEFLTDKRRHYPGCLVIDQHMPGMAGLDVVAALQREGARVPSILITGRLDPGIVERASALEVSAILEKPFPVTRLVEAIEAALA